MSFSEQDRYSYPLTSQSVVIDIGAYLGNFSKGIAQKYGCRVTAYEPITCYREQAIAACGGLPVFFVPKAVGAASGKSRISVRGDCSTFYGARNDDVQTEHVDIVPIEDVIAGPVDLLKINTEGSELEILEAMLALDLVKLCRFIQVQFHDQYITGWHERYLAIRAGLEKTHHETWGHGWQWENWELRHDTKPVL